MSAATLERVTLSDFQVSSIHARTEYEYSFPLRGLTSYQLTYTYGDAPADRFSDGEPYALPFVTIRKHSTSTYSTVQRDKAPQYVRDVIDATLHEVARAEHNRHRIAPLPRSLRDAWGKHGAWGWSGAKLRKAEEVLHEIERPGVRREQAREIAAWIVRGWMEREEHDELMAEAADDARAAYEMERVDLEAAHEADLTRRGAPVGDLAREARELLDAVARPNALEFAHGNTTTEKVLDLARDLEAALTAYENTEEA